MQHWAQKVAFHRTVTRIGYRSFGAVTDKADTASATQFREPWRLPNGMASLLQAVTPPWSIGPRFIKTMIEIFIADRVSRGQVD